MRVVHEHHDRFKELSGADLWDHRPAQTSRRSSASVLAAARLKRRLTQRCNKGCNSKVIIDGPPAKPKRMLGRIGWR